MTTLLSLTGSILALAGAMVSIYGAIMNNLFLEHRLAMQAWMISNIVLLAWAIGYTAGIWDGGLSGAALVMMYFVYSVTNVYGLMKK